MTTTQRAAARVIDAWDSTVLPVANDGRLQEAMEDLRAVSEAAMDTTPTLREAAQQALEALTPLANATTPAEREALTDADAQAADAASCDLRAALAEQAAEQAADLRMDFLDRQRALVDEIKQSMEDRRQRLGLPAPAAEQAPHPSYPHITQPYTLEEIRAQIASHDYSAELLLQHAMLLLEAAEQAEPAGWREVIADVAADISDHPSLAHEKLRRLLAAPTAPAPRPAPSITVGMLMEAGLMVGSTPDSLGTSNWAVRMLGALRALAVDQPDAPPAPARQEPLTEEQIAVEACLAGFSPAQVATSGAFSRFARGVERAHGITAAPAEGGA